MKARLLLALCLFSHVSLQAKTLSDLKKGDWFTLEYTQFHSSPEGNQSLRNADIFEYLITVTDRTHRDMQFSIRPVRVLSCKTFYEEKEKYKAIV